MAYNAATEATNLETLINNAIGPADTSDPAAAAARTAYCQAIANWVLGFLPTLQVASTGTATGVQAGGATAPVTSTGAVT